MSSSSMKVYPMKYPHRAEITWFFAFKALFGGLGKKGMPGLKAMILLGGLVCPFIFSLQFAQHSRLLAGAIPPEVPVIRTTGTLVWEIEKQGIREVSYVDLVTDEGKTYPVRQETYFAEIEALARASSPTKLHVEGFLLKNTTLRGGSSFWFTSVQLPDGRFLVTAPQSIKELERARRNREAIALFLLTVIFLWTISLLNVYRLKRQFSIEPK